MVLVIAAAVQLRQGRVRTEEIWMDEEGSGGSDLSQGAGKVGQREALHNSKRCVPTDFSFQSDLQPPVLNLE
jgi:hypothetical protein